jgi:hypothetical protein
MIRSLVWLVGLAATLWPAVARAQLQPEPTPPKPIVLRPAAAPVPALKYRLLPERRDLVAGNAAVFYHRAIEMVLYVRNRLQTQALNTKSSPSQLQVEETIARWIGGPIREVPRDEARAHLDRYRNALHEIELGARREGCDWEFDRRDEGFDLLMEEIQQARSLARLVVLRARLEVLEGRTEEAIHWLQVGFALTRHVAQGPTLIQSLAAVSIAQMMAGALEELIQAPGTPSLFWSLAGLPRPLIDVTPALAGERHIFEREIPRLRDLDSEPWSLVQARSFSDELERKLAMLTGLWARTESGPGASSIWDWGARLGFTARVAGAYPEAKRFLIAQGRPAARVEAMPAIQAVALFSYTLYDRQADEVFKWANLPYRQAYKGLEQSQQRIRTSLDDAKQGLPFGVIIPPIRNALLVPARVDRRLDALQCIEAVRLYAAAHDGSLPAGLEAITEAPAPLDPATGQPFGYTVSGSTASLTAPILPGESVASDFNTIRYELKPAR